MPKHSMTRSSLKTELKAVTSALASRRMSRAAGVKTSTSKTTDRSPMSRAVSSTSAAAHVTMEGISQFRSGTTSEVITGSDYLAAVTVPSTVTSGKIIQNILVTPTGLNSRLAAVANLWERYNFDYLELVYNPSVPTTTAGQIILTYDPDAVDATPSGDARPMALATDDNVTGPVYAPFSLMVRNLDKKTLYYTRDQDSEDRFEIQGQFYVLFTGAAPQTTMEVGSLALRYRVTFSKRCYEIAAPASLPPPDTYTSWMTTPVSVGTLLGALGTIYDAMGQPFSEGLKLGTKGILLKRGYHYLRTVFAGYPIGTTSLINLAITAFLRRITDAKISYAAQSKTFGTVFGTTTASPTTIDTSTILESAIAQGQTVQTATNHVISYVVVHADSDSIYSLDYMFDGADMSTFYCTGYSVEDLPMPEWKRFIEQANYNFSQSATWVDPPSMKPLIASGPAPAPSPAATAAAPVSRGFGLFR